MIGDMEVEALVELLMGLTIPEASLLADNVNSNIARLVEQHHGADLDIIEPTKLQECVHYRAPFPSYVLLYTPNSADSIPSRLIALESEMKRLGLSYRDLSTFIDEQERQLMASRALVNRISIEVAEFLEHFSGLHSLLILIRRHDYLDAGHKLQCRMMVNVTALQRCMPSAETNPNDLTQLLR